MIQLREAVVALGACRSDVPAIAKNKHVDLILAPILLPLIIGLAAHVVADSLLVSSIVSEVAVWSPVRGIEVVVVALITLKISLRKTSGSIQRPRKIHSNDLSSIVQSPP